MKLMHMIKDITMEVLYTIKYTAISSSYNVATLMLVVLPYAMYVMGQWAALERGYIGFGGEIFVPVVVGVLAYYMKEIGNRCNKGKSIPVPNVRFTSVDPDGEVSIEQSRLNELILYTADLEDWFTKRGML